MRHLLRHIFNIKTASLQRPKARHDCLFHYSFCNLALSYIIHYISARMAVFLNVQPIVAASDLQGKVKLHLIGEVEVEELVAVCQAE